MNDELQNNLEQEENKSAMILGFGLCAMSGFIIGLIVGCVMCYLFM